MSKISKHRILVALHTINKNWYFDQEGGWYKLSPLNLKEEFLFKNVIIENENSLSFDIINVNWAKKNAKKFQNKLNFDFSKCDLSDNFDI